MRKLLAVGMLLMAGCGHAGTAHTASDSVTAWLDESRFREIVKASREAVSEKDEFLKLKGELEAVTPEDCMSNKIGRLANGDRYWVLAPVDGGYACEGSICDNKGKTEMRKFWLTDKHYGWANKGHEVHLKASP
jgi:hypothetical protein